MTAHGQPSARRHRRNAPAVGAVVLVAVASLGWTPVPHFPTDRVATAGVADTFDPLRSFLDSFESEVDASYVVAVVANSDPQNRVGPAWGDDTGAYIDLVVEQWRSSLDPVRGVLVLIAVENRDVIVHPGSAWTELGFERGAVVATIDSSRFGAQARAGDYAGALMTLVQAIDGEIARRVANRTRRIEFAQQNLDAQRAAVSGLRARAAAAEYTHDAELHIADAETQLDAAADQLLSTDEVDRERAYVATGAAGTSLARAEAELERGERARFLRRRLFPTLVGIVAAAALVLAILLRVRRRRELRWPAEERIASWDTMLARAGERLIELGNEHPVLLGRDDLDTWYDGESRPRVHDLARRVDDLFIAFEVCTRLVGEARELVTRCRFPRVHGFVAAAAKLGSDEVVARTEDVADHRLFLPESREIRRPAAELMEQMDRDYTQLRHDVGRLEATFEDAWAEVDGIVGELRSAEVAREALRVRDLVVPALEARARSVADQFDTLRGRSQRDPLGQRAPATELGRAARELQADCERAADAWMAIVDDVRPETEAARARIAKLREEEHMRLDEPGFEPDVLLAGALQAAELVEIAVEGSRFDVGAQWAETARAHVAELVGLLDATLAARDGVPERVAAGHRQAGELRADLPDWRDQLADLAVRHADSALRPALDNVEEAEVALEFADTALADAARASSAEEQRYLTAEELVARAESALTAVADLFDEIDTRSDDLARAHGRWSTLLEQARPRVAAIRSLLDGDPTFASRATLDAGRALDDALATTEESGARERPDWFSACAAAEALSALADEVDGRARNERAAHAAVERLRPIVDALRDSVRRYLDSSEADRQHANRRFDEAMATLSAADAALEAERPRWVAVRELLETAQGYFAEAQAAAERDRRADEHARNALAAAGAAVQRTDRPYGHGVAADLTDARRNLEQGRRALLSQTYEEAATMAAAARTSAAEASRAAERDAGVRADAVLAAAQEAIRRTHRPRSSWGPAGNSSGSRWSGGSSRSFGSTRSFSSGSSFGRSSGRSSFGRSSGRSKW